MIDLLPLRYELTGAVYADDSHIGYFDADGGEWTDGVDALLREHGFGRSNDWGSDEDSTSLALGFRLADAASLPRVYSLCTFEGPDDDRVARWAGGDNFSAEQVSEQIRLEETSAHPDLDGARVFEFASAEVAEWGPTVLPLASYSLDEWRERHANSAAALR